MQKILFYMQLAQIRSCPAKNKTEGKIPVAAYPPLLCKLWSTSQTAD